MRPQRGAKEMHSVAVDMAERAEIDGPEGLDPLSRSLDDVAGGMDFVVEHDHNTLASRIG
jgi:hypothetical protein